MRATEERLRLGFKYFNRFMLLLWRLGLGGWVNGWPTVGGRILVLLHTGRKSGRRRRTPVNYFECISARTGAFRAAMDGDLYCTAGFGGVSDWYRNLLVNPMVEVWLPTGWWTGVAEDVTQQAGSLPILRQVLINSGFAAHMAGINPMTMTDEELRVVTKEYRLILIRRTAACTGAGGPGDLAWIWPLATLVLLLYRLLPKKRA